MCLYTVPYLLSVSSRTNGSEPASGAKHVVGLSDAGGCREVRNQLTAGVDLGT